MRIWARRVGAAGTPGPRVSAAVSAGKQGAVHPDPTAACWRRRVFGVLRFIEGSMTTCGIRPRPRPARRGGTSCAFWKAPTERLCLSRSRPSCRRWSGRICRGPCRRAPVLPPRPPGHPRCPGRRHVARGLVPYGPAAPGRGEKNKDDCRQMRCTLGTASWRHCWAKSRASSGSSARRASKK